ncbi:protein kinase [Chryseobacterium sp. Y16C]|uniref:serine/threonine protein kinase n=1 Tax=Chryseobacterium sp. Y16C TaxID=2920939 RepID=UPI001F0B37C6|nr:protein kinase [Chryseobacterium sp. Y16C]UMQ43092.1 protein kinase [Chryseobacterium sp. Y16C]
MPKKVFDKEQIFGNWKLIKELAHGGNSVVWTVENQVSGDEKVIKLLKKDHETARKRFLDEIKIITENQDNYGVMRIIDQATFQDEDLWYVMPKVQPISKYLHDKPSIVKVNAVLQIAKVLSVLHKKGVSHRDIKPQNLFFQDRFIVGDFGLVDYPDKEEGLTIIGNALGPRWTIAPEMRNSPENALGVSADVYSLAKTLWILLTGREKGFEGQYSPSGSVGLGKHVPDMYLNVLEDLLVACTENDAESRPDIDKFIEVLTEWNAIQADFYKKNDLDWRTIQFKLFPMNMPAYAEWTDLETICDIFNIIGGIEALNHMFFSNGGGLDLKGAKPSREDGFLELDFGIAYIVKPIRLSFCSFGDAFEWNYFYLELGDIEHIFYSHNGSEQLIELASGEYKPYDYIESYYEKYDDGENYVPSDYRTVIRLSGARLVAFKKTSSYNLTPSTYDGRHGKMGRINFRNYIKHLIEIGYNASYVKDENGKIEGKRFTHDLRFYNPEFEE